MNFTRQTIPTVSAVPEEPKQETAKQATVNIRVDANCTMLCDGEYIETQFQANKITKMNLPLGQHLLEFFDMDYPDVIVEQEVDWQEEGKAYLVIIKGLQEKIEAARQADEEKKRDAAAKRAEAEAERLAKEEAARRAIAEMERKAAEEAERKIREEEERRAMAEAEQKAKAEAERKAKEGAVSRKVINGHECVDMGLSVCWATCNIGASSPIQCGEFFAWGETISKNTFSEENYTYYSGTEDRFGSQKKVLPGGDITSGKHDAAAVIWGGGWRMPTQKEWEELLKKCECKESGEGWKIVAGNQQSIFIPKVPAGNPPYDSTRYWSGNNCYTFKRWVEDSYGEALAVGFKMPLKCVNMKVWRGWPIRPVLDKKCMR